MADSTPTGIPAETTQPETTTEGTPLGVVDKQRIDMYLQRWHTTGSAIKELAVNFHNCGVALKNAKSQEEANRLIQGTHLEFTDALSLINQIFFGVVSIGAPQQPASKIVQLEKKLIVPGK